MYTVVQIEILGKSKKKKKKIDLLLIQLVVQKFTDFINERIS